MTIFITQSWDTAIKAGEGNDRSACATFARVEEVHYLIHLWVGRAEYPELKRKVKELALTHKPDAVLIEDAASGQSLLQDLRREGVNALIAIRPQGDKTTRLARITPMFEAGQVMLPTHAPWLAEVETELLGFPHAAHDDVVDAVSQYLNWVRGRDQGVLGIRSV